MTKLRESFSISVPDRVIVMGVSSFVSVVEGVGDGASLTGETVRLTIAGALVSSPSFTVNSKLSSPAAWVLGV